MFPVASLERFEEHRRRSHLSESVNKNVFHKSISAQIRSLILNISNDEGYVDGFVGELTFAK